MTLLLLLAACGTTPDNIGVDPGHNTDGPSDTDDGNTTTETVDASVETNLEGTPIDGISFDIDGPEKFSAETTYEDNLKVGDYTVSNVKGSFNGANFISCDNVDKTLSATSTAIEVPLSFDFSGTSWTCGDAENAISVSGSCQVDVENVSDGFVLDGLTLIYSDSHFSTVGTISDDYQSIDFVTTFSYDGSTDKYVCTRE